MDDETVWLTQQQMADLFQTSRTNVVEHIKHIYDEKELEETSTCRKFRQVRKEGNREVSGEIPFYNLDMIISLGYRIKSVIATNFRRWATERLKRCNPQPPQQHIIHLQSLPLSAPLLPSPLQQINAFCVVRVNMIDVIASY